MHINYAVIDYATELKDIDEPTMLTVNMVFIIYHT